LSLTLTQFEIVNVILIHIVILIPVIVELDFIKFNVNITINMSYYSFTDLSSFVV